MIRRYSFIKIINLVTIALIFILPYYLFEGRLYLGGDDTRLFYVYPDLYLKNTAFFSWYNLSSVGINASNQSILPFLFLWSLLDLIINNKTILSYLAFSLPLFLGFVYFKKFVKELFDLKDPYSLEVYIGSLFFIFSPIMIFNQMFIFLTTIWLVGLVPAIGYYYLKYLKSANFLYIYISMIMCIVLSIAIFSIPWILGILIPLLFGLIIITFLSKKKEIKVFLKRSLIFFSLIILSQAFWLTSFLVPFFVRDKTSYAVKFISQDFLNTFAETVKVTATGNVFYPLLNLFHRQIAFDFNWKLANEFIRLYDKIFLFNLIFFIVVVIGLLSYKKYFNKEERRRYLFILSTFIFSLYLFTVNIGPLRDLFFLLGKLPGFVMFRNFYDKFALGYIFLLSILITISLVLVKKRFPKKYYLINSFVFFVIILNFSAVKSTVNSPLWQTESVYRTIQIPEEYLDFMEKIKTTISPTNTILSVPFGTASYTIIKDENSNNAFVGTSPVKIFSGINDISGDFSFNFTRQFDILDRLIVEEKYSEFNEFLYSYNINYVLVTKNIPDQVLKSYVFFTPTLLKQDERFLNAITDKKILTSSDGNYELYTTKKKNNLLQSNELSFKKVNQVKYILYIKNLKTPQELKFNDSFHQDWKLFLQEDPSLKFCTKTTSILNKTSECNSDFTFFDSSETSYLWNKPVFNETHISDKGLNNSWKIDPKYVRDNYTSNFYSVNEDGSINIELVLYFKQQLYFYLGIVISFTVIVLSTIYLGIPLLKKWKI